jgi:hypothetical protein
MVTLGAKGHADYDPEINGYYATDPIAIEMLLRHETFENVWENACGEGHLAEVLRKHNVLCKASDLIDRGYGDIFVDFLKNTSKHNGDIVTNPPFKYAQEFVEKSMDCIPVRNKVAMFLRIQFLEGKARNRLFKQYPPKTVYVFSNRIKCAMNGDFTTIKSSATCYAWFVWQKGYTGDTKIKWLI